MTPWIAGILIIIALLFFASRPNSPVRNKGWVSKSIQPEKAFKAAYGIVDVSFRHAFQGNLDTISLSADNVSLQSAKLAWMVATMALQQASPGFRNDHGFESMRLIAFIEFKRHLLRGLGFAGPEAGSELLEMAAREVAACTTAFDHTSARLLAGHPYPLNPFFAEIERSFRFAEITKFDITNNEARLDAAYRPVFLHAFDICRVA